VASFDELATVFSAEYSHQETKDWLSRLAKRGWLVRVRRGLYAIVTSLTSVGISGMSQLEAAQAIGPGSYASFAAALQYWGLYDQLLSAVDSVTSGKQVRSQVFEGTSYRYHKVKEELCFGFVAVGEAKVAELEKALLDYLFLRKDEATSRLVMEKLIEGKDRIDLAKLVSYAGRYGVSTQRALGYLLDRAGLDSGGLLAHIGKSGVSRMGAGASKFISKWRLYAFD
jgi:predicted transcriptional regulator of viral defense system